MLFRAGSYEVLYDGFRWNLPEQLNMAAQGCDYWAGTAPDRVAIVDLSDGRQEITYGRLREMADGLAQALVARGIGRGDRVGVLRSQGAWCAAAHVAIWKIGAISIPLFKLFKQDALTSRVSDAGAEVVVTDAEGVGMLTALPGVSAFVPEEERLPGGRFETVETAAGGWSMAAAAIVNASRAHTFCSREYLVGGIGALGHDRQRFQHSLQVMGWAMQSAAGGGTPPSLYGIIVSLMSLQEV